MNGHGDSEPGRLRRIVSRTAELTPLSTVAAKAIQMAEDERSAALDLASVISSDQALTAKLLRLSNSAYYGHARRISTVREAVVLLGMRTVRSVAIASGVMEALRAPEIEGFDQGLFWAHAVCVGLVAEQLAKETRAARAEDAFTAGVLHDMGKLAMMVAEPEAAAEVVDVVVAGGRYREAEAAAFGVSHHQVGARLAERWHFPDHLCAAIRGHHPVRIPASLDSIGDVIAVADLACNRAGLAAGFDFTTEPDRWPAAALPPVADRAIGKLPGGMATIEERGRAFLRHVSSRPPRWYAEPHSAPDATESKLIA